MILGVDISSYEEVKSCGVKFLDHGVECDPLKDFTENGVSLARIRVWVDPYDEEGKPYYCGTCDEKHFMKQAKMVAKYGWSVMIDFHYSDFWADPQKQIPPKAWHGLKPKELEVKVYEYTRDFLLDCVKEKINVSYIQIGNEITNGMLYPSGSLTPFNYHGGKHNYKHYIAYLKAASKACREVMPEASIIVHIERSANTAWITDFFTRLQDAGLDYDVIGTSYYIFWHGELGPFEESLQNLKRFKDRVMIIETGHGFTDLPKFYYEPDEKTIEATRWGYRKSFACTTLEIPLTYEGQCEFLDKIFEYAEKYDLEGICYWEPLCLAPKYDIPPYNVKAYEYNGDGGFNPDGSYWANTCLFDYNWEKTPAFDHFKLKK